jgi:hypothetical protein
MFKIKKNSDTQKSMKTRSSRMRDIFSNLSKWFGTSRQRPSQPPYAGTAVDVAFSLLISGPPRPTYYGIDPTTLHLLSYVGIETRARVYDLRTDAGFISMDVHVFKAYYNGLIDGRVKVIDIEVTTKLGSVNGIVSYYADLYAKCVGRLPKTFRDVIDRLWILEGSDRWAAILDSEINNILIYVDYFQDNHLFFIHSVMLHEAGHLYLDSKYKYDADWIKAQKDDGQFISTYARDNSLREDLAESILAFFAVRHRADRIEYRVRNEIINTIPNRIKFFESLNLDMSPFKTFSYDYPK